VSRFHENLISPDESLTLDGLFVSRVRRTPDREAYRYFDRASEGWHSYSWAEMGHEVARWQAAMAQEQMALGSRVAMQLRNCPEWVMFDQAALGLGLVTVPLYTDDRPDNVAYILREADVQVLLVQDSGRWRRLADALGEDSSLKRVLLLDDSPASHELAASDPRVRVVADWLPQTGGTLGFRDGRDPHALASIVYTSGTTGVPRA
jgi:long-chain acyl-CoA synthetase